MTWFDRMLRPELEAIHAYKPAPAAPDAVRLDANEKATFALSDAGRATLARALAGIDLHRYPDVRATQRLRERIAEREQCSTPTRSFWDRGRMKSIALIIQALAGCPDGRGKARVRVSRPVFRRCSDSRRYATAQSPSGDPRSTRRGISTSRRMTSAIKTSHPNAVFPSVAQQPHRQPVQRRTNRRGHRGGARSVAGLARRSLRPLRQAKLSRASQRTSARRSASRPCLKIGLAGRCVGWAILPREIAACVDKVRQPYNFNELSQRVGELAFGELSGEFDDAVNRIVAERERLRTRLAAVPGFKVAPSAANFLWVDTSRDAGEVYRVLHARGVIVRSFHTGGPRLARYLRITVGTAGENDRLVEALDGMRGTSPSS